MECECITSAYDYCKKVYGFYWSKFSHYFHHYFSDDVEKRKVRKENFLAVNLGNRKGQGLSQRAMIRTAQVCQLA
jgi:hypothetical protein